MLRCGAPAEPDAPGPSSPRWAALRRTAVSHASPRSHPTRRNPLSLGTMAGPRFVSTISALGADCVDTGVRGAFGLPPTGSPVVDGGMDMPLRRLGRCGLKVSTLSFGSWVTFGTQLDTGSGQGMPGDRR